MPELEIFEDKWQLMGGATDPMVPTRLDSRRVALNGRKVWHRPKFWI